MGRHNVLNATAAIIAAISLGISIKKIKHTLKNFLGVQRRLTKVYESKRRIIFDDYAHHPTEIQAVVNGARQVNKKRKIICVFQPHRYSRVKSLKLEFASSFKLSDTVVLCPVYSAGEKINYNFNQYNFSKLIAKKSKVQVINISNKKDLKNYLVKNLFNDEMVICMGAGSISNWIREISQEI
jgi:UDP-N-acetylmuramate--alanine ligase